MKAKIPENHPLRRLFHALTDMAYESTGTVADLGSDKPVVGNSMQDSMRLYIANLLIDFCDFDSMAKIKDAEGKGVTTVQELLLESEVALQSGNFNREDEVHRHIGDLTLFLAGIFPEYLKYLKTESMLHHPDHLLSHVKAGKHSYATAAKHYSSLGKPESALYAGLSYEFEINVHCINLVRNKLDQMRNPAYIKAKNLLLTN